MSRFVAVLFFVLFSIGSFGQAEANSPPLAILDVSPVMRSKTPPTGFPGFKKMDKDYEYWTIEIHLVNVGLPNYNNGYVLPPTQMPFSITSPVRDMVMTKHGSGNGIGEFSKPGTVLVDWGGRNAWPLIFMSPKSGKEILVRYRYTDGEDGTTFKELIDEVLTLEPNEAAVVYMTFLVPKWEKEKNALLRLESVAHYPQKMPIMRADTPESRRALPRFVG